MKINLGCGKRKMPGWINIDSEKNVDPDIIRSIENGLPFQDNSIEVVNARAILEHIKQGKLTDVMREIYRVLKPGGLLYVMVPHWCQKWMWSDPTHYTAWSREMMEWFTGKSKPSDIGIDFAFEELYYEELFHTGAKQAASSFKVSLDTAKKYLADIIDAHVWWLKKPGECGLDWQEVRNEIAAMSIYPNGYGASLKQALQTAIEEAKTPSTSVQREQRNKLLWFINVPWIGGTALWCLEAIQSMGSWWHHTVCYMSGGENEVIADRFKSLGCDFSMAGYGITKQLVESVNPTSIIISNVNPRSIEGWQKYIDGKTALWLTKNYHIIYVHHSEVTPWLPGADMDVFVSNWLMNSYTNLFDKMKMRIVVPSGTYIKPHLSNKPKKKAAKNVVVGRLTNDNKDKFPLELMNILKEYGGKTEIVGGAKYYKEKPDNVEFLDFYAMRPHQYMSRWDIFVYRTNVSESWGRVIAEAMASRLPIVAEKKGAIPELVVDGETGFLCETDEEFVEKLKLLRKDKELRVQMGKAGRKRIKQICSENPFTKHIEPFLIANALR